MTMLEEAMDQARETATDGPADRLLERLAERVGARATVEAVFGEPIRTGDLTVIPVAKVRWGFGGGRGIAGEGAAAPGSGAGAGGGVQAEPVGYLEIRPEGATYQPITDARPSPLLLLAGGIALAFVIRAIARLVGR